MEVEQLQLWARWLELQRDRVIAVMELLEEEEVEERRRRTRRRRQQRRREIWVRPWLTRLPLYGQYEQLLQELNKEDPNGYRNCLKVEANTFWELVDRISPRIEKQDTNFREAMKPRFKLAVTLRHLATGASYAELMYSFGVAKTPLPCSSQSFVIQEYSA